MATSDSYAHQNDSTRRDSTMSDLSSSFTVMTPPDPDDACRLVAELEQWAPMLERLLKDQMDKLAIFLDHKISLLMACEVEGTEEEQFEILQRLMKLQEGPLGKRTTVGKAIRQRLQALNDKATSIKDTMSPTFSHTEMDSSDRQYRLNRNSRPHMASSRFSSFLNSQHYRGASYITIDDASCYIHKTDTSIVTIFHLADLEFLKWDNTIGSLEARLRNCSTFDFNFEDVGDAKVVANRLMT